MSDDIYPWRVMKSDMVADCRRYLQAQGESHSFPLWNALLTIAGSKGLWVVAHYRFGRWVNATFSRPVHLPLKIILKSLYFVGRFLAVCLVKSEILVTSRIGPGFYLSNEGNIIFAAAVMGKNGTVNNNITSGIGRDRNMPAYGDNVWIGADSVIYGGITIGDNTYIEKSTVLSKNIPANMHVGGNPCQIIRRDIPSREPEDLGKTACSR